MNELSQDDVKELNLLIEEAQRHVIDGCFNWMELGQNNCYGVWKTRAKTLLGKALPSSSPSLLQINERQKAYCVDLDFKEYAQMLMGVRQYINEHQK